MPKGKHSNHARGSRNGRFNDIGVGVSDQGYIKIRVGRSHPMADANGWCYLHRLVAATAVGHPLDADAIVHHRNENRADNRWENLEITTRANHNTHHNDIRRAAKSCDEPTPEVPQ